MYIAASIAGGLGMYWGIGGLFHLVYYRLRRDRAEEWKCQPRRWLSPAMSRQQFLLGTANMTAGSIASGLFVNHVATGGRTSIYFDHRDRGLLVSLALVLAYFLLTDLGLYWAHRIFHRPSLFKYIHRWHHRYTSPTAFTAAAMHPIEFATYQSIMLIPLFVLPVHVAGVIVVLVYQNCVALIDHSGVDTRTWLPWQPPARFHDDHHVYFHVNYGQNMGLWDRVFGTWRREGRAYGVEIFGGRGAPLPGARDGEPPRYVVYGKKRASRWARERPQTPAAAAEAAPAPAAPAAGKLDPAA